MRGSGAGELLQASEHPGPQHSSAFWKTNQAAWPIGKRDECADSDLIWYEGVITEADICVLHEHEPAPLSESEPGIQALVGLRMRK